MTAPSGKPRLADAPDWLGAGRELVHGFARLESVDDRIRMMDRVCERLGGSLYPAFLQILCVVERNGSEAARRLVVDTLIHALRTGRLPAGRMPAWGAASGALDGGAFERGRSLGPIEYLCAWYAQPSELPTLDVKDFDEIATRLLRLVSSSEAARTMYCAKLLSDAEDPLSGSLARETRAALSALASEWQRSDDPRESVAACLDALTAAGEERLGHIETNPFF